MRQWEGQRRPGDNLPAGTPWSLPSLILALQAVFIFMLEIRSMNNCGSNRSLEFDRVEAHPLLSTQNQQSKIQLSRGEPTNTTLFSSSVAGVSGVITIIVIIILNYCYYSIYIYIYIYIYVYQFMVICLYVCTYVSRGPWGFSVPRRRRPPWVPPPWTARRPRPRPSWVYLIDIYISLSLSPYIYIYIYIHRYIVYYTTYLHI